MYDQAIWKRLRIAQLSKQPMCQACLLDGRVESANHVDHLFAWSAVGKDSFYRNVFQSLCAEHHSHKTHLEQSGIYQHYDPDQGVKDYALNDYSFVIAMHEILGSARLKPAHRET